MTNATLNPQVCSVHGQRPSYETRCGLCGDTFRPRPPTTRIAPGDGVSIVLPSNHALFTTRWWPKEGEMTGTVQKVFKNGRVAVAVHQLRNRSEDGCHTLHFERSELAAIPVVEA